MKIILGSSSIFRRKVLEQAGIEFEVVAPDIDEKNIRTVENGHTPIVVSFAKAQAVAAKVSEPAIIIACDQVIECNGKLLEKPESPEEVYADYKLYSEHIVQFTNGITILNTETGACVSAQEISKATFKPIPDSYTEEQIKKGIIFGCCGAIDQDITDTYATIIQGSMESTIGLPIEFVKHMIEKVKTDKIFE